ncbi:MAG: PAS domain S-box protein [Deltaproteobacteria bacterium]|nr:PAS domain S-box protein [Deltaproteobacteria bacterium]
MKIRLFHKFFIVFLAIGVAAVAISGILIEKAFRTDRLHRSEDEMVTGAQIIALMPSGEIIAHLRELAERTRTRLTLIDVSGRVLADSEAEIGKLDNHLNRSELQEARLRGKGIAIRYSRTLKKEMLYVAIPLRDGTRTTAYVRLSRSLSDITGMIDGTRTSMFGITFVVVVSSLLIALIFSFTAIFPIRRLAAFTGKIRTGSVSGLLRFESRDEIGELTDNLNKMVAALEEKIRSADEETRKLASLFSGMSEGVMVLDATNRIESVNRGMEGMIGLKQEEMTGKTVLEAFRNLDLHNLLERFLQSDTSLCGEIDLRNDRLVTMDVTISRLQGGTGDELKTMLVFHDLTRLKKLERIRTDFVANVTHEIRTPLTAIIGFAETLQQGAFNNPETARKFLYTIRENAERINRLVEGLLTLSGLELGETKLHLEPLRIIDVIDQVLTVIEARALEKGLTVRKELSGELPPILADRDRMVQILLNLLDNAAKFTHSGGTISVSASAGTEGFLTIRIADAGVGIPKAEIPRLGERFYRADKTRSREMGGTGLGLSIVKHLMMAHHGRISIDSTLGHGTTVSLYFPIHREGTDPENAHPDCADAPILK